MKIFNQTKKLIIAQKVMVADTFRSRMVGLLNKKFLAPDEALLITRCQSIHMFFMRFPIDVIFADKRNGVVGIVEGIRPFQFSPIFFKANYCLELPVGVIAETRTDVGDQLVFPL